jgi:HEAT repeat protein
VLNDAHRVVQKAAREALVKIDPNWIKSEGAKAAVPSLIAALRDKNLPPAAIEALGEIGDRRAIKPLVTAVRDSFRDRSLFYSQGLLKALRKIDPNWVTSQALQQQEERAGQIEIEQNWVTPQAAMDAIREVIATFRDYDSRVRKTMVEMAVEVLDLLGNVRTMELIGEALKDKAVPVREAAAKMLGSFGDIRAMESLFEALIDTHPDVREAAREALVKIDPNWTESEIARNAIPMFVKALKDEDWEVREAATEMLGKLGDTGAVELLVTLLKGDALSARDAAATALEKIGWKPQNETEKIAWCFAKGDWDELNKIGLRPQNETEKIVWHFAKGDWQELIKIGDPAFNFCLQASKDKDKKTREFAITVLCEFTESMSDARLQELLSPDQNKNVRLRAFSKLLESYQIDRCELCLKYLKDKTLDYRAAEFLAETRDAKYLYSLIE